LSSVVRFSRWLIRLSLPLRTSDSLTVGVGIEGASTSCPNTGLEENGYLAFPGQTATAFNAHAHVIAAGGQGMVRNYGASTTTSTNPFPLQFPKTLAGGSNNWPPALFQPHAIVIGLGSNDYSTEPSPPLSTYVAGYKAFIASLRSSYGANTPVFCASVNPTPHPGVVQVVAETANTYLADMVRG
jgi:hypothetical protein